MLKVWVMVYLLSSGQILMKNVAIDPNDIQAFYKQSPHSYGKSETKFICLIALNKEINGRASYESPTPCKTLEAEFVKLRFK